MCLSMYIREIEKAFIQEKVLIFLNNINIESHDTYFCTEVLEIY